jgi:hypothetical protein
MSYLSLCIFFSLVQRCKCNKFLANKFWHPAPTLEPVRLCFLAKAGKLKPPIHMATSLVFRQPGVDQTCNCVTDRLITTVPFCFIFSHVYASVLVNFSYILFGSGLLLGYPINLWCFRARRYFLWNYQAYNRYYNHLHQD